MTECDSIEWSDLYVLGDEKIDSEHKKLFELAKTIEANKNDSNSIKTAIKELVNYTKVHFAHEEIYMKNIEYIFLEQHKKIHKEIVKNLQEVITNFDTEKLEDTYNKILDFVKNGLVQHIMLEDKKVQHFRRNKVGLETMFTWKDDYLLDNEEIDSDHKKLFMIAYEAFSHNDKKEPKQHIKKVIVELNKYMNEHFNREEDFMESIGFPLIEEHKKMHEKIINQINELIRRIPTMSIEQFEMELLSSIDIWLVNHIIYEDHKIICFEKSNSDFSIDLDDIEEVDMKIIFDT